MEYIEIIAPDPPKDCVAGWSASRIEKINDDLYKFYDLKFINNTADPVIKLSGKHFLGSYNSFYWHFIHEDLANYEGLKLEISELELTLIDLYDVMLDQHTVHPHAASRLAYLEFFLNLYPQKVYLNRKTSNVHFLEAYFILSTGDLFSDSHVFEEHGLYPRSIHTNDGFNEWSNCTWDVRNSYGPKGLNIITDKLKLIISPDLETPKKIFISRKDVNSRLESLSNDPNYEYLISERYFNDSNLEKYFIERGYESIALEDFSYVRQLQIFMGATHIAGTVGAGFSKLYICNPSTKLYELHVIPIYGFDYGYYERVRGIDYNPIELRVLSESRSMTSLEMIEALQSALV